MRKAKGKGLAYKRGSIQGLGSGEEQVRKERDQACGERQGHEIQARKETGKARCCEVRLGAGRPRRFEQDKSRQGSEGRYAK